MKLIIAILVDVLILFRIDALPSHQRWDSHSGNDLDQIERATTNVVADDTNDEQQSLHKIPYRIEEEANSFKNPSLKTMEGNMIELTLDDHDNVSSNHIRNKRSSPCITCYIHGDAGGDSKLFCGRVANLEKDWNDQISSCDCDCGPDCGFRVYEHRNFNTDPPRRTYTNTGTHSFVRPAEEKYFSCAESPGGWNFEHLNDRISSISVEME